MILKAISKKMPKTQFDQNEQIFYSAISKYEIKSFSTTVVNSWKKGLPLAWHDTLALLLVDLARLALDLLVLGAEWMKERALQELVSLLLGNQLPVVIAKAAVVLLGSKRRLDTDQQNQKGCGLLQHYQIELKNKKNNWIIQLF